MNWLRNQMIGRYGNDQLCTALLIFSFLLMAIATLASLPLLMYLSYIPLGLCVLRMLSRDIQKRRLENQKFLTVLRPISSFFNQKNNEIKDRKIHKYYLCPSCKQRLRLPRGKGVLIITCPKCHNKFERKT